MTENQKTDTNGTKQVNPISLGTLYFGFALSLWASGQLSNKSVVGIAILVSLISVAFLVAAFWKSFLDILSKRVVRPLVFLSFIAFVYSFAIGWLQSFSQVSGIALSLIIYLGFAWIVTILLAMIRDTTQPSSNQNRVFLVIRGFLPYIVASVFIIFAVIRFINHDWWGGGYAIAIAILSLLVARGLLPVLGDVFE
jgi:hypothetical protein